ncbi:hypothetical protein JCM6882_009266 [Rhodosporidiobolus microsporus]
MSPYASSSTTRRRPIFYTSTSSDSGSDSDALELEEEADLLDPHTHAPPPPHSTSIRLRSLEKGRTRRPRGEGREWVMRSGGKRRHKGGGKQLTTKQRNWCIGIVIVLIIVLGGLSYWKFGEWWVTAYDDTKDFVVFPEVTTPPDWTKLGISVFNGITSTIGGAAETAISGVEQVTNVAKVTDVFNDAKGAIGGIFG